MRLHLLVSVAALVLSFAPAAHADDVSKSLESNTGRARKMRAEFAPQAQLFLEQKEAPAASKTALRIDSGPRLSTKSKD